MKSNLLTHKLTLTCVILIDEIIPFNYFYTLKSSCALIAQSVEQGTENPCVRGSNPRRGTIFILNFFEKAQFNPLGFFMP